MTRREERKNLLAEKKGGESGSGREREKVEVLTLQYAGKERTLFRMNGWGESGGGGGIATERRRKRFTRGEEKPSYTSFDL